MKVPTYIDRNMLRQYAAQVARAARAIAETMEKIEDIVSECLQPDEAQAATLPMYNRLAAHMKWMEGTIERTKEAIGRTEA